LIKLIKMINNRYLLLFCGLIYSYINIKFSNGIAVYNPETIYVLHVCKDGGWDFSYQRYLY
jgi:hypothetical protein